MEYESMTCDRCVDIHEGQRLGTNSQPCQCDCHFHTGYIVPNNSGTNYTLCDPNGTVYCAGTSYFGNH